MPRWIALFRGINVGGHNVLPMADLRENLEARGLKNVRTYIQSENVVFDSRSKTPSAIAKKITRGIEERNGFAPHVLLLRLGDLQDAIESNPYPEVIGDPKGLHFAFLAEAACRPDMEALEAMRAPTERFLLTERVFYLHAPDGIGRSKLAAKAEKALGVVMTARNYWTVAKLLALALQE